jgi:hypothetical protein
MDLKTFLVQKFEGLRAKDLLNIAEYSVQVFEYLPIKKEMTAFDKSSSIFCANLQDFCLINNFLSSK